MRFALAWKYKVFLFLFSCLALPRTALGQSWAKGEGVITLAYQGLSVHDHLFSDGARQDRGHIRTHGLFVNLDFGLTDRLAFNVAVPYISAKYEGASPHNPAGLRVPHESEIKDDGDYHGTFQDFYFGMRYSLRAGSLPITPFVLVAVPTHDYEFFAHSAVGLRQKSLAFGVSTGRPLGGRLKNAYFQGRYAYTVVEKFEGVRPNFSYLQGEVGYFLTRRFSARALGASRLSHAGLDFPEDYPDRTGALWLHHDRTQAENFLTVGGGFTFAGGESWDLFGTLVTTVWGKNAHALRYGLNVGVNLYFHTPWSAQPAPGNAPSLRARLDRD